MLYICTESISRLYDYINLIFVYSSSNTDEVNYFVMFRPTAVRTTC